jgi:hypothetical protein
VAKTSYVSPDSFSRWVHCAQILVKNAGRMACASSGRFATGAGDAYRLFGGRAELACMLGALTALNQRERLRAAAGYNFKLDAEARPAD